MPDTRGMGLWGLENAGTVARGISTPGSFLAAWGGPLAIGAGILGTAPYWGSDRTNFNRSKDSQRQWMGGAGEAAARQAVLDQINGQLRFAAPDSASSILNVLDSYGDVFGRQTPEYGGLETAAFRHDVGPAAQEIDEGGLRSLMGDAQSAGVLADRGIHLDSWRSHPDRPYRFADRPMTASERTWQRNRFQEEGGNK